MMHTKSIRAKTTGFLWKQAFCVFPFAVLALGLSGCGYNTMVSMKEQVNAAWAQVQNQLQRRNELIPNLVEVTKGDGSHVGLGTDQRSHARGPRKPNTCPR